MKDELTQNCIAISLPKIGQRVRIRLVEDRESPYDRLPAEIEADVKAHWFYGQTVFSPGNLPNGEPWYLYVFPTQVKAWTLVDSSSEGSDSRQRRPYNLSPEGREKRAKAMREYWAKKKWIEA